MLSKMSQLASILPIFVIFHSISAQCCNKQKSNQPDPWTFNSLPNFPNQPGVPETFSDLNNNNFGGLPGNVGDLNSFPNVLTNGNQGFNLNNGPIQLPGGLVLSQKNNKGGCGRCNCGCNRNNKNHGGFNFGSHKNQHKNNHNNGGGAWTETVKFGKAQRGIPDSVNGVPVTEFGVNGGLTSSNGFPSQGESYATLIGSNGDNHGIPMTYSQNGGTPAGYGTSNNLPYMKETWQGKK